MKPSLGYADYIKDQRLAEKAEVLDKIVATAKTADKVVFLGDNFNAKNNTSEVTKEFVALLERINKPIYVLGGNHEVMSNGSSAIDFLREIKGKDWHIFTDKIETQDGITFCPYLTKQQLGVENDKDGQVKVMEQLAGGELLMVHYAISDSMANSSTSTNLFSEVVLPRKELEKRYQQIFAGHIHKPQSLGSKCKTIIAGSIFTNEVGEDEKFIWVYEDGKTEAIKLPNRPIIKLENPSEADLLGCPDHSIVKVVITKEQSYAKLGELKDKLGKLFGERGAYLILEQIEKKRERLHYEHTGNVLEWKIEDLLLLYAKERKIDESKLQHGFELIRQ